MATVFTLPDSEVTCLCKEGIDVFLEKNKWQDWTEVKNTSVHGLKVVVQKADIPAADGSPRPTSFKTVVTINAPLEKVMEAVREPEPHMAYDSTFKAENRLADIPTANPDWKIDLVQTITNPAVRGWIASREFIDMRLRVKLDDKTQLLVARSVDDPSHPPQADPVRGINYPGGVLFEEIDKEKTRVTELVCVDLKGSLPAWVVAMGMGNTRVEYFDAMRKYIEKN
eukprot:TRINITY_DN18406_c0_g1_i1.p1 TRINITY_DN18406_c0_g1~~TRINITY_DN18406_c0_g1_i1.p1  ORF type:complete len:247 (-),score=56.38 TRINITY_DN18406_c0_g1_i1:85-762(-)